MSFVTDLVNAPLEVLRATAAELPGTDSATVAGGAAASVSFGCVTPTAADEMSATPVRHFVAPAVSDQRTGAQAQAIHDLVVTTLVSSGYPGQPSGHKCDWHVTRLSKLNQR